MALGFRAGLFNIGAEGQVIAGGMAAVVVGFSFAGLPACDPPAAGASRRHRGGRRLGGDPRLAEGLDRGA